MTGDVDGALPNSVPGEVLQAYGISSETLQKVGGAMINVTYFANQSGGGRTVLQRLGGMFEEAVIEDFSIVTGHLAAEGWEVPRLIGPRDGGLFVRDAANGLWRAMSYIDNEPRPATMDRALFASVGELLGKLHATLGTLNYAPRYKIPHFRDTFYHAQKLNEHQADLPDGETRSLAAETLQAYADLPALPDTRIQLLHGDPRTDNQLFREGKPFTYIDFDTVMLGAIWVDLGDLLRSLVEDAAANNRDLSDADILAVAEAYRDAAGLDINSDKFLKATITAAKTITLELTMRFLNDIVEPYFEFDPAEYESRLDFDLQKAGLQQQVYARLSQL